MSKCYCFVTTIKCYVTVEADSWEHAEEIVSEIDPMSGAAEQYYEDWEADPAQDDPDCDYDLEEANS